MIKKTLLFSIAFLVFYNFLVPNGLVKTGSQPLVLAQDKPVEVTEGSSSAGINTDILKGSMSSKRKTSLTPFRKCEGLPVAKDSENKAKPIMTSPTITNQMQKIIQDRVVKIHQVLENIKRVRQEYIKLFPRSKKFIELSLEDIPIQYNARGQITNSQVVITFHYSPNQKIDCIILDSYSRNINFENQWTHKIIRFRHPDLDTMELRARKHNYDRTAKMKMYTPENQYHVLQVIFSNLLKTLYKMDLIVAGRKYYYRRTNRWQGDL